MVENAATVAVLAEAFVVGEEERLVLDDRPAEHAAELIALQRRLLPVGGLEEAGGVQRGVADELPAGAAELVGAARVGDVDRWRRRSGRTRRSCCW